jgi:hypothetical protein
MTEDPVTYQYVESNLLRQRYHYMYTPYEGPGFLQAYLSHRRQLRNELAALREQALTRPSTDLEIGEEIRQVCLNDASHLGQMPLRSRSLTVLPAQPGEREFATRDVLLDLWHCFAYDPPRAENEGSAWVDLLLRRFEVTKRLCRGYTTSLRPIDRKRGPTENYALLAALLMQSKGADGNVKYLNAVLKLTDLLASAGPATQGTLTQLVLLSTVVAELKAMQALLEHHRIEL